MLAEKALEVVGHDGLQVDRGIETAGTHRFLAHVPQRNPTRAQSIGPLSIGNAGSRNEEFAHDAPEGVVRLRVILTCRERGHTRQ
jgi:hypothetical protein